MSAIKNFFKKKKMDIKFSMAGAGHRLDESRAPTVEAVREPEVPAPRQPPSESAQRAAAAAAARLQGPARPTTSRAATGRSLLAQARAEARAAEAPGTSEHDRLRQRFAEPDEVRLEAGGALAVRGVFFSCPFVSGEVLPHAEWEPRIRAFLAEQSQEEPGLTAAVMLHTLNKPAERVAAGIDVLCRLLRNVQEAPDEPKFRRLRLSNRLLAEQVLPLEGALQLLQAAGFAQETEPADGDGAEPVEVLKLACDAVDVERLVVLQQALREAEPVRPQLDRAAQLLLLEGAGALAGAQLPADFFALSSAELAREQAARSEALAAAGMLRTKAMREREARQELRRYRFALLRVRLPGGRRALQAVFGAAEPLSALFAWLRTEALRCGEGLPFGLCGAGGAAGGVGALLEHGESAGLSLAELGLCPSVVLNLTLEPDVLRQLRGDLVQDVLLQTAQVLS